jgi:HSP20 family protein
VYEVDDEIIVRIEVAGLRENDLAITIEGQYLIIQGIRPDIPEKRAYHQMEIPFGQFSLEIDLPSPVEPGMAQANYRDGFLRIRLPKAP